MSILQLKDQPPLIQAIFAENKYEVRMQVEAKQDVNCLDCEKRTPLHAAAYVGHETIALCLIEHGARVNAKDSKWITPLHRACSTGSYETVCVLLNHQADVCARDRLWLTPFHVAAAFNGFNGYKCLSSLLDYVPNVNITDRSGRTALHYAVYNRDQMFAQLLIDRGCIVNACDKKDNRPLHCATQVGSPEMIKLLLKNGADINAKDRNQNTPLHFAVVYAVQMVLIESGAEIDAQNSYGDTPLHTACLVGNVEACRDLVSYGANIDDCNFRGQTPLHIAAASTHGEQCMLYLLELKATLNKKSLDGRTPLHMTAIHGRFTRSKKLIDEGALVNSADKNGLTPLHFAAQFGHELLTQTLLSYGADPTERGFEGRTPLHMCCLSGYVECCRKFLQTGVDINITDDSGKNAIHYAAYKGSIECLDLLVSNGGSFLARDHLNRLPLHYAALQGHYQCVFTLVGIGSPTNAIDIEGCTPLHLAAGFDQEGKCVKYLLSHRADPLVKNNRGYTALHYAIGCGYAATVDVLLPTLGKLIFETDDNVVTLLHLAVKWKNINILKRLLTHYRDVNIQTDQGVTPLILAASEGHAHSVQFLMRYGAKVAISDKRNKMTAVHYSAKNGRTACLTMLLNNTEDQNVVNLLDKQQRSSLMLAVSGNHLDCVQTLLKFGADPNLVDSDGHSSLFRAVVTGQNNVVHLLLNNKAAVQGVDVNGKTVLHLAAACGHTTCLQMILEHMSEEDVLIRDGQGCTALHWACYNGHSSCVELLLHKNAFKQLDEDGDFSPVHCATFYGSDKCLELLVNQFGSEIVHLKDCKKRTPLHVAALNGHIQCAKFLIEQTANVAEVDDEIRTPLIAAAQFGQHGIVELLLANKADRSFVDSTGNTALHWACIKKHVQTALILLDDLVDDAVINLANSDQKTALHISARNGLVEVTRELIKKGASLLAVDNKGLTPALCCAPNNEVAQCLALILQTLPLHIAKIGPENDPLALLAFYNNLVESRKTISKCSQTRYSIYGDAQVKSKSKKSKKPKRSSKVSEPISDVSPKAIESEKSGEKSGERRRLSRMRCPYLFRSQVDETFGISKRAVSPENRKCQKRKPRLMVAPRKIEEVVRVKPCVPIGTRDLQTPLYGEEIDLALKMSMFYVSSAKNEGLNENSNHSSDNEFF